MIYLLICVFLLVLNSYTLIGPLGYYVALPFFGLATLHFRRNVNKKILLCFAICVFVSVVGVFSSVLHNISQIEHLKVAISIFVYYLIGVGLFVGFRKSRSFDDLLIAGLYVGVLNGAVILLEVQFPQLRAIVESVFVESGNIDWAEGFRYRGLASGGGASLSVLSALMVYICLYLYGIEKIGPLVAITSLAILVVSVFFIGRTGVLLIVVAFALYAVTQGWRSTKTLAFIAILVIFILSFGLEYIREILVQEYGEGFYRYSLGLFLEGRQGIDDEGTVNVIAEFLTTVPKQFPEILIGYGFYGGSDFYPWTDSGYARMFLSVGFLFGALFYACAFYIFKKSAIEKTLLFWPLILILAIAETKEGMMFAGYSSRLLFILMGFWAAQRLHRKREINSTNLQMVMPR